MYKIRRGKDFKVIWSFFDCDGNPYILRKEYLALFVKSSFSTIEITDFSVQENKIIWVFKGKDQKNLGDYSLELFTNNGEDGMIPVDSVDAFTLVQYSKDESSCTCDYLKVEDVSLKSDLDIESMYILANFQEQLDKKADKKDVDTAINTKAEEIYNVTSGALTGLNDSINQKLAAKVDKVSGKQLSTEDFTTALKQKLQGLNNYDDAALTAAIDSLQNQINTLVNGNASSAIDTFNEIVAFLNGLKNTEDLAGIIASIEQQIASVNSSLSSSITDLQNKDKQTDLQITELSEEIGEVLGGYSLLYETTDVVLKKSSKAFEIFGMLEVGKTYLFRSEQPCNIEYYTASGGYKHLFDKQTEVEFVCPTDFDAAKKQIVVNTSDTDCYGFSISKKLNGVIENLQRLQKDLEGVSNTIAATTQAVDELQDVVNGIRQDLVYEEDYTANDGDYNRAGNLSGESSYWHSSPILLHKGDTIYLWRQYGGNTFAVIEVTSEGAFVQGLVSAVKEQLQTYTAENDIYVSVTNTKVNATTPRLLQELYIVRAGLNALPAQVDELSELASVHENNLQVLDESNFQRIALVQGTDYTLRDGYINKNGTVISSSSYWHSTPISVKRGDTIHIAPQYLSLSELIVETDAEETFYKPIIFKVAGKYDYKYVVSEDTYIILCYNAAQKLSAEILRGGVIGVINEVTLEQSRNSGDAIMRSLPKYEDYYSLLRVVERRDQANWNKAKVERQQALDEINGLGESHILKDANGNKVEGYCGYYVDGSGNITDDTIKWEIYDNGVLHIHGYGRFYDFIKGVGKAKTASAVEAMTSAEWYYGFVTNVNGYTNPHAPASWTHHEGGEPITYPHPRRYYSREKGDAINPINGKPYGYAAPWYIYRSEIDWNYEGQASYNDCNPNGFKYTRVVIDENLSMGGITYIGMWTFYRCCVESLILPTECKYIAEWGVRYSPTIKTLIWGDKVTECESFASSRMEAMTTIHISSKLATLHGEQQFGANPAVSIMQLPQTLQSLPYQAIQAGNLIGMDWGGVINFGYRAVATPNSLPMLELPNGVLELGEESFLAGDKIVTTKGLRYIHIPSSVNSIGAYAFQSHTNVDIVKIDSETISESINNERDCGMLVYYAEKVLIPTNNKVGAYIKMAFDKVSSLQGYDLYVRRSMYDI